MPIKFHGYPSTTWKKSSLSKSAASGDRGSGAAVGWRADPLAERRREDGMPVI